MPDWVVQLAGYGAAAAGIYAGIRADLARLHVRVEEAHRRLDELIRRGLHA